MAPPAAPSPDPLPECARLVTAPGGKDGVYPCLTAYTRMALFYNSEKKPFSVFLRREEGFCRQRSPVQAGDAACSPSNRLSPSPSAVSHLCPGSA